MLQHAGNSMHLPKVLTRAAMAGGRPGKHDNINRSHREQRIVNRNI